MQNTKNRNVWRHLVVILEFKKVAYKVATKLDSFYSDSLIRIINKSLSETTFLGEPSLIVYVGLSNPLISDLLMK